MVRRVHLLTMLGVMAASLAVGSGCRRPAETAAPPKVQEIREERRDGRNNDFRPAFVEVTEEAGIEFRHHSGVEAGHFSPLETLGGGVALLDYDGDGQLDLLFAGGGTFQDEEIEGKPSGLFRQLRPWQFEDVSDRAGDGFLSPTFTHGCFVADFDNDGFPDLLVTGYGGVQLWRNLGDGTFEQQQRAAGLNDGRWSTAAGWGDIDGDGNLDLYIAHYVNWSFDNHPRCSAPGGDQYDICPPESFAPMADTLWLSNGDGTFRQAPFDTGLRADGKGLGVVLADLDGDGRIDIYVANDSSDNFLYLNDGFGGFAEMAHEAGVAVAGRGMPAGSSGVDVGDFDLDGLPDLWVTNAEGDPFSLYRNDDHGQFLDISHVTGMSKWEGEFVGFGTKFVDLSRNGYPDLVFANGHVRYHPVRTDVEQKPMVLLNEQGRRFTTWEPPDSSYFATPHVGRGLAVGDLSNNGVPDLVFTHNNAGPAVLRNESSGMGQWLQVRLIGRQSPRDGHGARLALETERTSQLRIVAGGTSYLSHGDLRPLWGFPQGDRPMRLTVHWPSGQEQVVLFPPANSTLTLIEP